MTTGEQPRHLVTAIIQSHGMYNGKPKTDIDVPAWGLRHPLPLYNVNPEVQALPIGPPVRLLLRGDRCKEDKDPTKMFNWFWSVEEIAADQTIPAIPADPGGAPAPTGPAPAGPMPQPMNGHDIRDRNIGRQVALKAAVDTVGILAGVNPALVEEIGGAMDATVLKLADEFAAWIAEPPPAAPAPATAAEPQREPVQDDRRENGGSFDWDKFWGPLRQQGIKAGEVSKLLGGPARERLGPWMQEMGIENVRTALDEIMARLRKPEGKEGLGWD